MNERILELAEKAGFDVNRLLAPHPGGFPREDFLALESFAQLIVKECADIASINGHQVESPGYYVLKHFGIEQPATPTDEEWYWAIK